MGQISPNKNMNWTLGIEYGISVLKKHEMDILYFQFNELKHLEVFYFQLKELVNKNGPESFVELSCFVSAS